MQKLQTYFTKGKAILPAFCIILWYNSEYLISLCHLSKSAWKEQNTSTLSEAFTVETGLKQGDALALQLLNLALKKGVKMI